MLFLPVLDLHNLCFYPQILVVQTVSKSAKPSYNSSWESLLSYVRNDQVKFEVRWVTVRDGIREDGLERGLIRTPRGLETGLNNPHYGVIRVLYPVSSGKIPPPLIGPPLGEPLTYKSSITFARTRIFIINPPQAYRLSNFNNQKILDVLVGLLDDPNRAWAAHVTLAKMLGITGISSKIDQTTPNQWWELEGKTQKAKQEWTQYLQNVKPSVVWNPLGGYYKHPAPDGRFIL
jgi:hypothetical protein